MKQLNVQTVLIDIDGTIVEQFREKKPLSGSIVLADLLYRKKGIPQKETLEMLTEIFDPATSSISSVLPRFNVTEDDLWQPLIDDYKTHTRVMPDAAEFLIRMKELQLPVYTASTNAAFTARIKLAEGGLAFATFSPYITGYFPGNAFDDPRGKYDPDYFCKIIRTGGFEPAQTLMVGDEIEHDLIPALRAGIAYVVIVNRSQKEPIIEKDGGIFVNSLSMVAGAVRNVRI